MVPSLPVLEAVHFPVVLLINIQPGPKKWRLMNTWNGVYVYSSLFPPCVLNSSPCPTCRFPFDAKEFLYGPLTFVSSCHCSVVGVFMDQSVPDPLPFPSLPLTSKASPVSPSALLPIFLPLILQWGEIKTAPSIQFYSSPESWAIEITGVLLYPRGFCSGTS